VNRVREGPWAPARPISRLGLPGRRSHINRLNHTFQSGGDECAAWLYPAASPNSPSPIVVMAHGFTGTRRDRLGVFAERFAAAGIAAMPFDYRGFGDSAGPRDVVDVERQLEDWRAAIAFARGLPGVDPERVATLGSSMGGGHALAAARADSRIAAAVSQVPFLDAARQRYRPSRGVVARMVATAQMDRVAAALGRPPRCLPAVGRPDEPAFINAPEAERGWRRVVAMGEDSRWRNRAAARVVLQRPYRVANLADNLHCPWLVCVAEDDQVAAPPTAIEAAQRAPQGELRLYPGLDHFDIYDGPGFESVVADEVEFLGRHLMAGQAA
jgi:cephalosporin-C deacetylase-like acetyl esterase